MGNIDSYRSSNFYKISHVVPDTGWYVDWSFRVLIIADFWANVVV